MSFEILETEEYFSSNNTLSFYNLGEILSKSIISSINLILIIGGFIVLFSIIISMLNTVHFFDIFANILAIFNVPANLVTGLLTGFLEVTSGISSICSSTSSSIYSNIIACSFVLGLGGFSVFLQVLSIISRAKISIKPYLFGKLLQAFFAAFYTYLII